MSTNKPKCVYFKTVFKTWLNFFYSKLDENPQDLSTGFTSSIQTNYLSAKLSNNSSIMNHLILKFLRHRFIIEIPLNSVA